MSDIPAWLQIAACGTVGGVVNIIMFGDGFEMPRMMRRLDGVRVFLPGFLGTLLVSAVTALVQWGLYVASLAGPENPGWLQLAGGILSGLGGGRLLKLELEKRLLVRAGEEPLPGDASGERLEGPE